MKLTVFLHAILLTLLIEATWMVFPLIAGKEIYRGINIPQFGTDQHYYLTRGNDVLDGHGLGNSLQHDGKTRPDTFFTLNERLLLTPLRVFGIADGTDVVWVYNLLNTVGVFIVCLLIYFFAFRFTGSQDVSLAAMVGIIGGYSIVFNHRLFYIDSNLYGRAMYPYLSSIGLFITLILLLNALKKHRPTDRVYAGIAYGALFYNYFFAWSFTTVFLGIFCALLFLWKRRIEAFTVVCIIAIGLGIGSFNLFKLFGSLLSHTDRAVSYFHWLEHTHAPMMSIVAVVSLALFGFYAARKRSDPRLPFMLAIILASFVIVNQQVITGIRIQPGHFYWYFIVPLNILIAIVMASELLRERFRSVIMWAIISIAYLNTAVGQFQSTISALPLKIQEQRWQPMLMQLSRSQEDRVVLTASSPQALLIPIYTHHDLFWQASAVLYRPNIEQMKDMLIVYLWLNRDARLDVRRYLDDIAHGAKPSSEGALFTDIEGFESGLDYYPYQRAFVAQDASLEPLHQSLINDLVARYKIYESAPDGFQSLLTKYYVTYLVHDKITWPDMDPSVISNLRAVFDQDGVTLYEIVASIQIM